MATLQEHQAKLQAKLEELLGSKNVYYQAPGRMNYPAIKYEIDDIENTHANNWTYRVSRRYKVTVIDRLPDNPVIEKLLKLPMCSYDRHYVSDNLNHDVLTLYY